MKTKDVTSISGVKVETEKNVVLKITFKYFYNRILNKLSCAFLKKKSVFFIVVPVWSTKKRMWVSSV